MGLDTFDDEEKPTIEQQIGGKHNDGFILEDAIIVKKQGKEQHSNDKLKKELPEGIGDERIHNGNTGKGPMIVDGEKEQEEELSGRLKSMKVEKNCPDELRNYNRNYNYNYNLEFTIAITITITT
jgi:hypothetical protein